MQRAESLRRYVETRDLEKALTKSRPEAASSRRRNHARNDSEMPSFAAITLVAPGVRFRAFDIFFTPDFAFANVFICRTSSFVQARRTIFFAFAILFSECFYGGVGLYHGEMCS